MGGGSAGGGGSATGGGSASGGGGSTRTDCNHALGDGHHVTAPAQHPFAGIRAMQFDAQGNLFVLNWQQSAGKSYLSMFAPAPGRAFLNATPDGVLKAGQDFAFDGAGDVYVLDFDASVDSSPTVVMLDALGAKLNSFSTNTSDGDGIFYDTDGTLLVSAAWLVRLDTDGGFVGGPYGGVPNLTPFFTGIARDSSGLLWAGELNDNVLVSFDASMNRLGSIGGRGTGAGQFDGNSMYHEAPERFTFDAQGNLYAADPGNGRVMKLSTTGDMLGSFDFGGSDNIGAIAVDPLTGNVLVSRTSAIDVICAL